MTKEEAIKYNRELCSRRHKDYGKTTLETFNWRGKRCAICNVLLAPGDSFIDFIPVAYQSRTRNASKVMHINHLEYDDTKFWRSQFKVAKALDGFAYL